VPEGSELLLALGGEQASRLLLPVVEQE